MKNGIFLILILLALGGLAAEDSEWEDPTFGGLRPAQEFTPAQKKTMERLALEVTELHKEVEKRLNFIAQNKRIANGKFVMAALARRQFEQPKRTYHLVDHQVELKVAGNGLQYNLENLQFMTRRADTNKALNLPMTKIMYLENEAAATDWSKLKITLRKIDPSGEDKKTVGIESVYQPKQRLRMARLYKSKVAELIKHIDRQIGQVGNNQYDELQFIKAEMDNDSSYHDF